MVSTAEGSYWHINDPRFDTLRNEQYNTFRQHGWTVIDGSQLCESLSAWHRSVFHFHADRGNDWGLTTGFEAYITSLVMFGQFAIPSPLELRSMVAFPKMLTHLCQEWFYAGIVAVDTIHFVDVAKGPGYRC